MKIFPMIRKAGNFTCLLYTSYRPMEIKNPVDPEWEYRVRAVKKVNAKQIRYIVENEFELEEKIRKNRRPTLRILGIEDGAPRSTKRH